MHTPRDSHARARKRNIIMRRTKHQWGLPIDFGELAIRMYFGARFSVIGRLQGCCAFIGLSALLALRGSIAGFYVFEHKRFT